MSLSTTVKVLRQAGVVRPHSPVTLARMIRTVKAWGTGPAGGFAVQAIVRGSETAVIDELGSLTFAQLHQRANSPARARAGRGVKEGDGVAVICRNHPGFLDATVAINRLGADVLLLNPA